MQSWHGPMGNAAFEPIPHNQVIAFTQFLNKRPEAGEIVAIVSIAYDDILSACSGNATHEGITVAFGLYMDDARAHAGGDGGRAVHTAIVSHDDFARNAVLTQ
jgi:hypothetical protein